MLTVFGWSLSGDAGEVVKVDNSVALSFLNIDDSNDLDFFVKLEKIGIVEQSCEKSNI